MNEHPEVRWQPPSSRDLGRFPPRNATCRAFRAMLRDYADGDLPAAQRRSVELHVHECRDCALALSRVEHETLRLRRALSGVAATAPATLRSRVLERILSDDETTAEEPETTPERSRGVPLPVAVMLAVAAMLVGALVMLRPWASGDASPSVRVESARETWLQQDAVARRIESGETLPSIGVVRVDRDGRAVLLVTSSDAGSSDLEAGGTRRVTLTLAGDSRLALQNALPVLRQGTMIVHSGRLVQVGLGDGTRVELGRGSYHFDVTDFRGFDSGLRSEAGGLRVRLEVMGGDGALLARVGADSVEVGPGQVARYAGWSPLVLEPSLDANDAAIALKASTTGATDSEAGTRGLQGSVVDARTGLPVAGAVVRVRMPGSEVEHEVDTDGGGHYLVPADVELTREDHVLVAVRPPAGEPDLALLPLRPAGLIERGGRLQVAAIALRSAPVLRGAVRDPTYRWLEGARILPCIVDELTGRMLPLHVLQTGAGPQGSFALRGLPVDLAPYQALVLIVTHEAAGVAIQHVPDTELAVATDLRLDLVLRAVPVPVDGLPGGQRVRFVQTLGAGEGVVVARRVEAVTEFSGRAVLPGSEGRWFWVRESDGAWVPLEHGGETQDSSWVPVPERAQDPLVLESVPGLEDPDVSAALGHRYTGLPGPGGPAAAVVVVEQGNNRRVPGAELFALRNGDLRLLGFADVGRPAPIGAGVLLGIGPQGSLGVLEPSGSGSQSLQLVPGGALKLAPALRPGPESGPAPLRMVCKLHGGPLDPWVVGRGFVRFAASTRDWTTEPLPAGEWLVTLPDGTVREVVISPDRVTVLE